VSSTQAERMAEARAAAEAARTKALEAEPWSWDAVPTFDSDGELAGMVALPTSAAVEVWGSRLAMDAVDCVDDDEIVATIARFFKLLQGDTAHASIVFASAIHALASLVVPILLSVAEDKANDYDVRVKMAIARTRVWEGRAAHLHGGGDQ
jgi:hypothetical protein